MWLYHKSQANRVKRGYLTFGANPGYASAWQGKYAGIVYINGVNERELSYNITLALLLTLLVKRTFCQNNI